MQAATIGTSPLAQKLLGSWSKAPKAARDDYEHYMKMVSSLLGGEDTPEALQVSFAVTVPQCLYDPRNYCHVIALLHNPNGRDPHFLAHI